METITTTIKREYFAAIVDGSKRVECRKIKPYWTSRLAKVETPFRLVLRNGMRPPVPVVTVRIDRIVPSPGGRGRNAERRSKADATGGRSLAVGEPRIGLAGAQSDGSGSRAGDARWD